MSVPASLVALTILCGVPGEPARLDGQRSQPEEVVRQFYSFLLSDEPPEHGPALFSEPSLFLTGRITQGNDRAETARLWTWMRSRKAAFSFWNLTVDTDFDLLGVRRIYGVDRGDKTERFIGVTVFSTLFPRGKDGIWKEVFFPLESRDDRNLINAVAITVNGICFDPRGDLSRKAPLYESLGLRE